MSTTQVTQQVDLNSDVAYVPASAWNSSIENPCPNTSGGTGLTDHSTDVANASATLIFQGNRVTIGGARYSLGGTMSWSVDNGTSGSGLVDLNQTTIVCDTLADVHTSNGTHTLVMSLLPSPTANSSGKGGAASTQPPSGQLHLWNITVSKAITVQSTPLADPPSSSSHGLSGATVAYIVVGVSLGVALVLGLLRYFLKRKQHQNRQTRLPDYHSHTDDIQVDIPVLGDTGMREYRSTTALSYGRSPHLGTGAGDEVPLMHMQVATPVPTNSTSGSARRVAALGPPHYSSNVGHGRPDDSLPLGPPPSYEESPGGSMS